MSNYFLIFLCSLLSAAESTVGEDRFQNSYSTVNSKSMFSQTHHKPNQSGMPTLKSMRRRRHRQRQGKPEAIPPVVLLNSGERETEKTEEGWRFQAEILRAECKFLRMERLIALRTLDRERVYTETTLKSALHSLVSARRKVGEGPNASSVLEEEIEELAKKLAGIQRLSQLERVRKKMNMEDVYDDTCAAESASSSRRYEFLDLSSSVQDQFEERKENICKVIVRRIMEEVRAETEEWSEMQDMVGQVREEMERLQADRDFWEGRALHSDNIIQSLNATVQEWKQKALSLLQAPEEVAIKKLTPLPSWEVLQMQLHIKEDENRENERWVPDTLKHVSTYKHLTC